MTDKFDRAKALFETPPTPADPMARAQAIASAMEAFDEAHDEEKSTARQGSPAEARPRLKVFALLADMISKGRDAMTFQNSNLKPMLAGGASLAVLTLAVLSLDSIRQDDGQTAIQLPELREEAVQLPADEAVEAEADGLVILRDSEIAAAPPAAVGVPAPLARQKIVNESVRVRRGSDAKAYVAQPAQSIAPVPELPQQPTADFGRDRFKTVDSNPVKVVAEYPVSTFSVDVDTASYAFMRASVTNGILPPKASIRPEEWINYFDYSYAAPETADQPFASNVALMPTPWNANTQLMRIGIEGFDLPTDTSRPAANLVFLIDTSGSMQDANKLPLLKNAFRLLVQSLKPTDTVSIVTYAGSAGTVLEPTQISDEAAIFGALERLDAGGSTAGGEGIRQAYDVARRSFQEDGFNRVILATDGDFNVGIQDTETLKGFIERQRETGVSLSVLGFGRGNLNDQLMQALAQNGNGNAAYIDSLSEAQKVLVDEVNANLFTIASDVKIQVEFNPANVAEYRLIGYETRALNREDFNNDAVDAGEIGAGHTVTALYEITPSDSAVRLVEPLRYSTETSDAETASSEEIAFVKIRAKRPGEATSELFTTAVTADNAALADDDARFAAAVAAYADILKGGQYTGDYTLDDVAALARSARGDDPFGYRAEFIRLVMLAKSAMALEPDRR